MYNYLSLVQLHIDPNIKEQYIFIRERSNDYNVKYN